MQDIMRWILITIIFGFLPFVVNGDRWDITEPPEVKDYKYVDVTPNPPPKIQDLQKQDAGRGPASLVPPDKLQVQNLPPPLVLNKFSIIATNDSFLPKIIRIPYQTDVEITLMTNELESCFVLSDLGIRRGLRQGQIQKIVIPAQSEVKEFTFHCALQNIEGKIVVEPPLAHQ